MLTPKDYAKITARFDALERRIKQHEIEIADLKSERDARISELEAEIVELKAKLNKNSSNSSKPPSKDPPDFKRNQTRFIKSNRRPGGQKGQSGSTLKMVDKPNVVREYAPAQTP